MRAAKFGQLSTSEENACKPLDYWQLLTAGEKGAPEEQVLVLAIFTRP
jgi:hypothetical protein